MDNDTGILTWRCTLAPMKTERLEVRYSVSAPNDVAVSFE